MSTKSATTTFEQNKIQTSSAEKKHGDKILYEMKSDHKCKIHSIGKK